MTEARNVVIKNKPKSYKASDAAYRVGGNSGFFVAMPPKNYPLTAQQKKVKEVAAACGIKSGIKKSDLQKQMKDCVGPKMRK